MLTRRHFLGTAITCALAMSTVTGCGGDDGGTPGTDAGGGDAGGGMVDAGSRDGGGGSVDGGGGSVDGGGGDVDAGGGDVDGGAMCTPTVNDTSHVGDTCSPDGLACPAGYTCFGFSGALVSYSCEIGCTDDCDCATPTTCATINDKAGAHHFCRPPAMTP